MLGSFNNWNSIQFSNKTKTNEDFDEVHKVVLYGISDNIYELVQNEKYGAINTADTTKMGYYVVKLLSEPKTSQYYKIVDKKLIKAGELIVKAEYLSIMKSKKTGIGNNLELKRVSPK